MRENEGHGIECKEPGFVHPLRRPNSLRFVHERRIASRGISGHGILNKAELVDLMEFRCRHERCMRHGF